jgi:hypothetical protein
MRYALALILALSVTAAYAKWPHGGGKAVSASGSTCNSGSTDLTQQGCNMIPFVVQLIY